MIGARSLTGIIRQFSVQAGIDRKGGDRAEEDCVTVGQRLGGRFSVDESTSARLVLDRDGLAEVLGELLADQAHNDVVAPAQRVTAHEIVVVLHEEYVDLTIFHRSSHGCPASLEFRGRNGVMDAFCLTRHFVKSFRELLSSY